MMFCWDDISPKRRCDFVAHIDCATDYRYREYINLQELKEEENEDSELDQSVYLATYEVKNIKVGEDGTEIATEIQQVSHEHDLKLSDDEIVKLMGESETAQVLIKKQKAESCDTHSYLSGKDDLFVQFTWMLNIMQKPFVLCRLFNNEEKSNKGGPAKSKPALSDVTELVQSNNDNDYDKAYVAENQAEKVDLSEEDIELLMGEFYVPPEDSPSSLPLTTPDVSAPITVKTSHKETQSEPTLAPASQELPEQLNTIQLIARQDLTMQHPLHVDLDLDMDKAFEMFYIPPTGPLDCNLFSPSTLTPVTAVSYPSTAEASLEAQSMPAPASVFPELGSEADNYRTSFRCLPEEKYDGITTKTVVPIEYNGYNTYVAKNQVAEVTSDVADFQVEAGSNMFPDTPQPLGCDKLSPLHSNLILSSPHQMSLLPLLGQT
uniref:Uncharacterized protein n=1 Tax=Quercus lobata TaxID=97700 RepID=A0A7N2LR73_QUELO